MKSIPKLALVVSSLIVIIGSAYSLGRIHSDRKWTKSIAATIAQINFRNATRLRGGDTDGAIQFSQWSAFSASSTLERSSPPLIPTYRELKYTFLPVENIDSVAGQASKALEAKNIYIKNFPDSLEGFNLQRPSTAAMADKRK